MSRTPTIRTGSPPEAPLLYPWCDNLSGALILFMIVFTPWAYGTTEPWSIWTMNCTGFVLGATLLTKHFIRRSGAYQPLRLDVPRSGQDSGALQSEKPRPDALTIALAALTVFILAYTLVSALNARATYLEDERRFEDPRCIEWLPHSYDRLSTWTVFWSYLGLAGFFWAARDWLLTKPFERHRKRRRREHGTPRSSPSASLGSGEALWRPAMPTAPDFPETPRAELPARMRLVLWVLCINGAVLALEAILQRLSGTNKLLWQVVPRFTVETVAQFGPYAYRANAATYFNLVWPVCLGFWLVLRRSAKPTLRSGGRVGSSNHLVLLPGAVLMAACPIISTTRGGALIAAGSIFAAMGILLWSSRQESFWFKAGACSLFGIIIAFSAFLGLKQIVPRFRTIFTDQMSQRTEIYRNALPIASDFPVYGSGAGSFGSLYQLYRAKPDEDWAAYAHDDWLETRINFGWVGFGAILLMLVIALARWFWRGAVPGPWEFTAMTWVSVGGCLLHAKFDFPFQIYSLQFLFLLHCVLLFCLSRPSARA